MRRLSLVLLAALAVIGVACGGGTDGGPVPTTITLAPTTLGFTTVGRQQTLTPTVLDQDGNPVSATLTWSSNNNAVASVNNGVVTAAGNGTTTIRATAGSAQGTATVTVAQVAMTVAKFAGDNQTGVISSAAPALLVVRVTDSLANPVPGASVAFAATLGGGNVTPANQTTGTNGRNLGVTWTFGGAVGAQQATATVGSLTPVTFAAAVVTQIGTVALHDGNGQQGLQTFALNRRPAVIVRDTLSVPKSGVTVNFTVTGGGGSVQGGSVVSGADGVARVGNWIVQNGANTLQAVVATPGYQGGPINFAATGLAPAYFIDLRYLTAVTPSQQTQFTNAAARWQQLIYGDLPNVPIIRPAGQCGANSPAINETVDDLLIFVTIEPIDGAGGVLGSAGPCLIRTAGGLPLVGRMRFDAADVATLETNGQFGLVMLHEMGHVIGYGTVWGALLVDSASAGGTDPHFIGVTATEKFNESPNGASYAGGQKVPVENTGGPGTADGHWRESVFATELMTGFLNVSVPNPLSNISTASLGDMSYTVNYAASDSYMVPAAGAFRLGPGSIIALGDDIWRLPIHVVDEQGRVLRVIQP